MTEIEDFIKKNFVPVEDKPGYVWFSKRNFQIISIKTLAKCLQDALARGLCHLPVFDSRLYQYKDNFIGLEFV